MQQIFEAVREKSERIHAWALAGGVHARLMAEGGEHHRIDGAIIHGRCTVHRDVWGLDAERGKAVARAYRASLNL